MNFGSFKNFIQTCSTEMKYVKENKFRLASCMFHFVWSQVQRRLYLINADGHSNVNQEFSKQQGKKKSTKCILRKSFITKSHARSLI